MSLLEAYVAGVREGDADKVAAVFAEDGVFYDEAPTTLGMDAIDLKGREAILANFRALLANGGLVLDDVAFNGRAMRYDVVMGPAMKIRCLGVYTERDGLIARYDVTAVD
jgi:hypothetical protein